MIKSSAIIFDLDGTLVDSARDLLAALNHVLRQANRRELQIGEVRHMVGDGARAMIVKGFSETGGLPDKGEIDVILQEFLTYYGNHITDHTLIFPGVEKILTILLEQGIPLGLCTNKSLALTRKLMDDTGLAKYFAAIVGGDSYDYQKPDPRHLTATLDMMNCRADGALMVGDSITDINAAKAAGIPVIAVSFGYSKIPISELAPDIIIDHYDDFFEALKRLKNFRAR